MIDIDINDTFNRLLNIYEKYTTKEVVISAYCNVYFAMMVERILSSDSRLILNFSPERLNIFKLLIGIVRYFIHLDYF